MRQMDDNLIVRIATNQALFMSLLFTAVTWLQINGQLTNIQVRNLPLASLIMAAF
jgi:fumarate reductase subunit C